MRAAWAWAVWGGPGHRPRLLGVHSKSSFLLVSIACLTASLRPLLRTVAGLVSAFYAKLERDHGVALVAGVFGRLAVAREGLSERGLTVRN